ncbi:MAG TPA: hypothetical protein VER17_14095 [Tepidisphaeraceae bacterium]|nr:hypothetical protein [Tepidisphaeraceae bacterium]
MRHNPHRDHPTLLQLVQVRDALLRLHKALLDGQRAKYERANGRVGSPGEMLKLVIGNADFDWLHRLSELVVEIDEQVEDKQTVLTPENGQVLIDQAKVLLTPDEGGAAVFGRKYYEALQEDPAAGAMHAELRTLMKRQ